ncbi:condensation domain-containing protein [Pseudoalteromonas sp. S16_S37]|uniref:condensation domain-containing protein n=1 Tax=Pseudoalteromonas sp. S16_S37 TaxID=2720228 RepID=UPI0016812FC5|nr:condensation domain-containing protein [Pseudoalteromonas sp. S16_S37]MBD1581823.1 AMP-binding protein [Pseudoalteromonas sp. S16_S37]
MSVSLEIYEQARNNNIVLYLKGDQLAYVSEEGGFPAQLKEQIREHKDSIISFLKQLREKEQAKADPMLITPVDNKTLLPLSYAQQGLWFVDKLEGGSSQYNIPAAFRLRGALNIDAIHRALDALVERHEVLRSIFVVDNGEPFQRVMPSERVAFPVIDLADMEAGEQQVEVDKLVAQEMAKTFDLSTDLMLRAKLLRLSADEHIMMFTMHHIVSDGWSQAVLVREFIHFYDCFCKGIASTLAPLEIQYGDYASWQRKFYDEQALDQQFAYWKERLDGAPKRHSLPLDYARLPQQKFAGRTYTWMIDDRLRTKIKSMAKQRGSTLFMVLYSVYSIVIGRWSQTRDVVIGSPIAGRTHPQVAPLIGYFINSIVYRSQWDKDTSFAQLLEQNRVNTLVAYDNQNIPLETLVDKLKVSRELSHSPIFQLMFTLQNNETSELDLPGLQVEALGGDNDIIKYDMEMEAAELDSGIQFLWNYSTYLFNEQTVKSMAESFNVILEQIADNPDIAIEKLKLQRSTKYVELPELEAQPIHLQFEQMVQQQPSAVAIESAHECLTYAQLNGQANQFARYLQAQGFCAKDTLYIDLPHTQSRYVAMLAALKLGASYSCDVLAASSEQWRVMEAGSHTSSPKEMVMMYELFEHYDQSNLYDVFVSVFNDALQYGKHRLSHLAVYRQIKSQLATQSIDKDAQVLLSPDSCYVSASDWLGALLVGAKLHLAPNNEGLALAIASGAITHATISAAQLASIPWQTDYQVQQLCITQADTNMQLLWQWASAYEVRSILNVGPYSYLSQAKVSNEQTFNLGLMSDYQPLVVLHEGKQVAPVGARGRLHIQGDTPDVHIDTGLTARALPDGTLELLASPALNVSSQQLQVEQFIARQQFVEQVAVTDDNVSIRYSRDCEDVNAALATLVHIMKHSLPAYMVPEHLLPVPQLPLLPSGAIDRLMVRQQVAFWKSHIKAFAQLPVNNLSTKSLTARDKMAFALDEQAQQALVCLADRLSIDLSRALCVALTIAQSIHDESKIVSHALSGVTVAHLVEPVRSVINLNQLDEDLPMAELLAQLSAQLELTLSCGAVDKDWVTAQYNDYHNSKRDSLYSLEVNFTKPSNVSQPETQKQDVNVAGVLLQISTIDLHRVKGEWYVDTDLYSSSTISALTSGLNAVLPWLTGQELHTLVEVKQQLKEQVRNRMRSAKRKFKPGGIRK